MDVIQGFPATSNDAYPLNTISMIKGAARTYPEVEVVSREAGGEIRRFTYREAFDRIQQLANALVQLGIKPGDRVGVLEWNTHRFFELFFAVSGIGAVLLQINPRISLADRAYVINHSRAKLIFVNETLVSLIEPIQSELTTVAGYGLLTDRPSGEIQTSLAPVCHYEAVLAEQAPSYNWPLIDEHSAYSACYTTGTTGKPKGVYYSHRCIYLHSLMNALMVGMSLNDVVMQTVPMFHCHGWGMFFSATLVGAKLVFPGFYSAEKVHELVDLMRDENVTVTGGAPAIFMPMLEYIKTLPSSPKFTGLRMISGASEPSLAMMKGFWDLGGAEIIHGYGATETTPLVTINRLKPSLNRLTEEEKWELRKKQGLPLTGLDVEIRDADGRPLPHDGKSVGEVLIRGPWITTAYFDDERTDGAFVDGYWKSGDAGTIDENGYLKITDRFKDIIKSGGEWISSIDLENALMAHPAVLEATVVGIEHPQWEERPLALVVLRETAAGKTTKADLLDFIAQKFAKWQLPDEILFVEAIPKTSVGKFSKKDIRAKYGDLYLKR
ncbi:MAG: long-chain fatty acid--CoA ligase [Desulfobacterales bacterium]